MISKQFARLFSGRLQVYKFVDLKIFRQFDATTQRLDVEEDLILIGNEQQWRKGLEMLVARGFTVIWSEEDEELRELRDDVTRLNAEIENLHRIIVTLAAERSRIQD